MEFQRRGVMLTATEGQRPAGKLAGQCVSRLQRSFFTSSEGVSMTDLAQGNVAKVRIHVIDPALKFG